MGQDKKLIQMSGLVLLYIAWDVGKQKYKYAIYVYIASFFLIRYSDLICTDLQVIKSKGRSVKKNEVQLFSDIEEVL